MRVGESFAVEKNRAGELEGRGNELQHSQRRIAKPASGCGEQYEWNGGGDPGEKQQGDIGCRGPEPRLATQDFPTEPQQRQGFVRSHDDGGELPSLDAKRRDYQPIKGELPSPLNPPKGCSFHPRCREFMPGLCDRIDPRRTVFPGGQEVRCLLHENVSKREVVS